MKKKWRLVLAAVLAVALVVSLVMVLLRSRDYQVGEEDYAEAADLVALPDFSGLEAPTLTEPEEPGTVYVDPYADALRAMDFTALREVNDDVLGWIVIPGTGISYPLLQGTDNTYYLKHTWKGWNSVVGAIFLDWQNSPDLSDFNTIVYGHRMNNGSMFAGLKYYKQQSYWANHPCFYISDDNGTHKYDIFAAYEVSVVGTTYQIGFPGEASRQAFLDYCQDMSLVETGITPTVHDRIVTLSTCTGNGHATRWVVQGVLKGEAPTAEPETEVAPETETAPEGETAPETGTVPETAPEGETAPQTETAPETAPETTPAGETVPAAAPAEQSAPETSQTADPAPEETPAPDPASETPQP